jgi:hypothetical protein
MVVVGSASVVITDRFGGPFSFLLFGCVHP